VQRVPHFQLVLSDGEALARPRSGARTGRPGRSSTRGDTSNLRVIDFVVLDDNRERFDVLIVEPV
jgi:hypothetical protein